VGTSTGGILACSLAAGVPLRKVIGLYREHGKRIFLRPLPSSVIGVFPDLFHRKKKLAAGNAALRQTLLDHFGAQTLGGIYEARKVALAITAVDLGQHRSWVFKTPHLKGSNLRDSRYSLVDVCLATSAAPLYRSLAAIDDPDEFHAIGYNVFVDGGLWANNPVLVGLIDALEMAEPSREVEIYCLGTCPRPSGENVSRTDLDWGLGRWKFGGDVASLSVDVQEYAYDQMVRMFIRHLDRPCSIVRFPREPVPAALMPYLNLDETRPKALDAMVNQARNDANFTNSRCNENGDAEGERICRLFHDAPELQNVENQENAREEKLRDGN
jgi:uncharacterized protein